MIFSQIVSIWMRMECVVFILKCPALKMARDASILNLKNKNNFYIKTKNI